VVEKRGALCSVLIRCPPQVRAVFADPDVSTPAELRVTGIVDTGASVSFVTAELANTLRLVGCAPLSFVPVAGIGKQQLQQTRTVCAEIAIQGGSYQTLYVGVSQNAFESGARVLIGRDLLKFYRFEYDGPRDTFAISWAN